MQAEMEASFPLSVCVAASNAPCEDRYATKHGLIGGTRVCSYGVFDGHGGTLAVEIAADRLLDLIFTRLSSGDEGLLSDVEHVVSTLNDAFFEVDQIITADAMTRQPGFSKNTEGIASVGSAARRAGCCALVLLVISDRLYFAHVGDCRAVLIRSKPPVCASAGMPPAAEGTPPPSPATSLAVPPPMFESRDLYLEKLIATKPGMKPSGGAGKKRKATSTLGGETFSYSAYALEVVGVTSDHAASNAMEALAVSQTTSDPRPIRKSENDKGVSDAPMRVAGTLSVTRALGDCYLKYPLLSLSPYSQFVPYISSAPTVTYKMLHPNDRYIILASDGLWNYVTARDVHMLFRECQAGFAGTNSSAMAETLVKRCVEKASEYSEKTAEEFFALEPGKERRTIVDDVTVLVLTL